MNFKNRQLWFHVKYECYKNSEFSTLWDVDLSENVPLSVFICENADFTKFSHSKIQLYKKGTILTDERALKNPSCNSLSFYNTIFKNSKIQNSRKLDLDGFFRVLTNIFWWGCDIWKQNIPIPKSLNWNSTLIYRIFCKNVMRVN